MLLHYLGKLKNHKFALCIHVKHVSSVTFYHLSNRYLPNVMKISAKINTVQNINILLFVRSLSLTNWRSYGPISDRTSLTLQLTRAESVSSHMSVQMVNIWTLFVNKVLETICFFHVFLVQVASIHRVRFLLCWCLMVDRPTLLDCKALSLLGTVNEQKVKCCYSAQC